MIRTFFKFWGGCVVVVFVVAAITSLLAGNTPTW